MKKFFSVIFIMLVFCMCALTVSAEGGVEAKGIYLEVYVPEVEDFMVGDAVFSLYSESGEMVDQKTLFINKTDFTYEICFDVDFVTGDKFLVELTSGMKSFLSYDAEIPLYHNTVIETYAYQDDAGNAQIGNRFLITATPFTQQPMSVYVNNRMVKEEHPIKLVNGVVFCEMHQLMQYLYMSSDNITVDGDTVKVEIDGKSITATVGTNVLEYESGNKITIDAPTMLVNDKTYLAMEPYCAKFAETYTEIRSAYATDVVIRPKYLTPEEEFILKSGVQSKTDYLIWISKKDFRLYLFKGGNGNWRLLESHPCSIGAPSTPTVTGEFEYHEKVARWQYNGYYVGPIMRFYRGYAIHTVLLWNNGTEYDGRVGHMISHGCVRIKKAAMENLVNTVPMYTKVYVTP